MDVVRVLARLVGRLAKALKLGRIKGFRDRRRAAHRRMYEIQLMTTRQRQAAGSPQRATYRALALKIDAIRDEITHYCGLGARVIEQTCRRMLDGEQVPNAEKIYSIFEPHTDLIKRGKVRTPVEFGHKVFLAESAKGLITQYDVLKGNSVDEIHVAPSLKRHRRVFRRAPDLYGADRGFFSENNVRRVAPSRWCAFHSTAAARRRNVKLSNDRRRSSKASAFAPASRGASRC